MERLRDTLNVGKHISGTSIFSVFLEFIHEFKICEQQQNKCAVAGFADIS
jgi:hypothetical protein